MAIKSLIRELEAIEQELQAQLVRSEQLHVDKQIDDLTQRAKSIRFPVPKLDKLIEEEGLAAADIYLDHLEHPEDCIEP